MLASLLLVVPLSAVNSQSPTAGSRAEIVERRDYQLIEPAQPTSVSDGEVEVAEIFMYGCIACYAFEMHLYEWRATSPSDVRFVRIPASFNAVSALHARAFYAAEALGLGEEIHDAFFEEIHRKRNALDNETSLTKFFAEFGVDEPVFRNVFDSPAVVAKVGSADEFVRSHRVMSTPTVIVNGKYLTSGNTVGTYEGWFRIIDELVTFERSAFADGSSR